MLVFFKHSFPLIFFCILTSNASDSANRVAYNSYQRWIRHSFRRHSEIVRVLVACCQKEKKRRSADFKATIRYYKQPSLSCENGCRNLWPINQRNRVAVDSTPGTIFSAKKHFYHEFAYTGKYAHMQKIYTYTHRTECSVKTRGRSAPLN